MRHWVLHREYQLSSHFDPTLKIALAYHHQTRWYAHHSRQHSHPYRRRVRIWSAICHLP
jgi:hypothetical protein